MTISIIVAAAENGVIGKDNKLPWRLPADMKFFKDKTSGHCVITGRKNYESIPPQFRPLPNRTNIVVTRRKNYSAPGAFVANSIEDAIRIGKEKGESECFIIGGADIYRQTLALSDVIYLTRIKTKIEGDAFFPDPDTNVWLEKSRTEYMADEKNPFDFSFITYVRL